MLTALELAVNRGVVRNRNRGFAWCSRCPRRCRPLPIHPATCAFPDPGVTC